MIKGDHHRVKAIGSNSLISMKTKPLSIIRALLINLFWFCTRYGASYKTAKEAAYSNLTSFSLSNASLKFFFFFFKISYAHTLIFSKLITSSKPFFISYFWFKATSSNTVKLNKQLDTESMIILRIFPSDDDFCYQISLYPWFRKSDCLGSFSGVLCINLGLF